MEIIKQDELKRKLRAGQIAPVYFLYGNEPYLIQYDTELIKKTTVTALPEMNYKYYDTDHNADEIYSVAFGVPMLSLKKCVVVSDCNLKGMSEKELKVYLDLCENPSDVSVVVFTFGGADIALDNSYKSKTQPKAYKKLAEAVIKGGGVVAEINHLTTGEIVKTLVSGAARRHCILEPNVARYMIERCSDDLTTLLCETEKLCAYLKDGKITTELIDKICNRSVSARIFDMSKAVLQNNITGSMDILSDLLYQKVNPQEILRELSKSYIDIFRMSAAARANVPVSVVAKDFSYNNRSFVLNTAAGYAKRLSARQIEESLSELSKTDLMLKGGSRMPKSTILEMLIVKLLMIAQKGEGAV